MTDLVKRDVHRDGPNQLWVTDISEHPTREGKLYCCVVLDVCSRRVVGWAIDSRQRGDLALSALARGHRRPRRRRPRPGRHHPWRPRNAIHLLGPRAERARRSGLLPSLGTVGDPYDNAVVESFWARMQTELLHRQRWNTRLELANAIFDYIEGIHNRRRRHSALNWMSPAEFETTTHPSSPTSSPACP